jgi:DNA-binding protein H-NS
LEETFVAKRSRKLTKSRQISPRFASMSVEALLQIRDQVAALLSSRASELQSQLAQLGGVAGNSKGRGRRKRGALRGRKVAPQFRSKKSPKLTWSGRGVMAGWMKEEMKGTKLKKEDFRIPR